ncbi:hypothetical protein V6N11_047327 [Hibiscus sabdariffa]|uniref:Uncharacterized protein n=1 Tax=Hibiscus sabdariffa TaxID=183260 RepID=A0ABR2PBX1_9ROSI
MGLAPLSCCLARPVHWHHCLHRLGVRWTLPWPLFASVCPNASIECFNPSSLLCIRPALSASPWLCPPGCKPYNTHGTFVSQPRCPFHRLAACPIRALPWPVRPLVAWHASHHWAGLFGPLSCAASLRFLAFVSFLSQVTFFALFYLIYLLAVDFLAANYSHPLLLFFLNSVFFFCTLLMAESPPAPTSSASASTDHEHDPYDPMVHTATSDMLEDALTIPADCALLVDIDGIIQANGEDLVHGAIDETTDSLIREVAESVLGCTPLSVGTDATVASVTSAPMSTTSPTAPRLSPSAPTCACCLPMSALPEHQEFDAWYTAQTRPASVGPIDQHASVQPPAPAVPPPRAPKRHASHSDPTKVKRPRPSSSTSRIPSVPKAGMSSANNSSVKTARQSHREQ